MKSYYFNTSITGKSSEDLIKFLNENDDVRLYMTSEGGECLASQVLMELINEKCKEIVGVGELSSNAFRIFFSVKIPKRIMDLTFGIFHQCGASYRINENGKLNYENEKWALHAMKRGYNDTIEWCKKIGMNNKEIKKIKNNEDVYFPFLRMMELLNYIKS